MLRPIVVGVLIASVCAVQYDRQAALSKDYQLYWTLDTVKQLIYFKVDVLATGWVGFGLSPNGRMPKSDVVLMAVLDDGQRPYIVDSWAEGHRMPTPDNKLAEHGMQGSQDYNVTSAVEVNGRTIIEFHRKWITPDVMYDIVIQPDVEMNVIWAYHRDEKPVFLNGPPVFSQHSAMGSRKILFGNRLEPIDDNTKSIDLKFNNFYVPLDTTSYYCKPFTLANAIDNTSRSIPPLHAVSFEPIIDQASILHHMILYDCGDAKMDMKALPFNCIRDMPHCTFTFGWAVGGLKYDFPKDIGVPIGGQRAHNTFVLQIHYNNPLHESREDSSGMKIHYTPNLRAMDAGVMTLGVNMRHLEIPPFAKDVHFKDVCHTGQCRSANKPNGGVVTKKFQIFAAALHMHQIGRSVYTEQYRKSKFIGEIGRDDEWDFNAQRTQMFDDPIFVEPGDELITHCVYDNHENRTVRGGMSSADEMCFNFVYYAPLENGLEGCMGGFCSLMPSPAGSFRASSLYTKAPYILVTVLCAASLLIGAVFLVLKFVRKEPRETPLLAN